MPDRPIIFSGPMVQALLAGRKTQTRRLASSPLAKCATGDRLWVRESFMPIPSSYGGGAHYMATEKNDFAGGWKPSIHMPRPLSRLTLTIVSVKVEQLQDISEVDAQAEGVVDKQFRTAVMQSVGPSSYHIPLSYRGAFANLWNHIHGPSSWERNPEVVALTFTVSQANIDALPKVA